MRNVKVIAVLFFLGLLVIGSFGAGRTLAYPPFLKQIKELGYEAKDCTFCHEKNIGGKGWNKRGLWLKDQKKERKAPQVDVKWLKNYKPEGEAQNKETTKENGADGKSEARNDAPQSDANSEKK